jgi:hypothetical protein
VLGFPTRLVVNGLLALESGQQTESTAGRIVRAV